MKQEDLQGIDAALAAALPPGALYTVGGRVRDEVRSAVDGVPHEVKDVDYVAVGLTLDELLPRLRALGRSELVGARFAVVKVTLEGTTVDVALPRTERSTGVGHREFDVHAGADVTLEDDLARRDFRMNMLARALPDGTLVDPYGGEADIRAHRIDVLRAEAFAEDPLRMLRACQFAARLEYRISEATMAAMREAAPLVATVSAERVRDELVKMLSARRPSIGFEAMREGGVLAIVLPELLAGFGVEQNEWHAYDVYHHTLATVDAAPADTLTVRLAALFHDIAKPQTKDGPHFYRHEIVGEEIARTVLSRLRFSNDQVEDVAALVRHHMYVADPEMGEKAIRRLIRRVGTERLTELFALRAADIAGSGLPKRDDHNERFQERVSDVVASKPPFSVRDLAIGGDDVVAMLIAKGKLPGGSRGGPAVGAILGELLEWVLDDPTRNEHAHLLRRAHELAAENPG
ncbi:MAG: HD domain-containing protein [Candidatus Eremiobacteraeota bacterium]|nr:HD domain-containing protein [Candidatus Eremiobacteraeota bacterium]